MTQNHLKMQRQQRFCLLAGLLLLGRLADARWDQNRVPAASPRGHQLGNAPSLTDHQHSYEVVQQSSGAAAVAVGDHVADWESLQGRARRPPQTSVNAVDVRKQQRKLRDSGQDSFGAGPMLLDMPGDPTAGQVVMQPMDPWFLQPLGLGDETVDQGSSKSGLDGRSKAKRGSDNIRTSFSTPGAASLNLKIVFAPVAAFNSSIRLPQQPRTFYLTVENQNNERVICGQGSAYSDQTISCQGLVSGQYTVTAFDTDVADLQLGELDNIIVHDGSNHEQFAIQMGMLMLEASFGSLAWPGVYAKTKITPFGAVIHAQIVGAQIVVYSKTVPDQVWDVQWTGDEGTAPFFLVPGSNDFVANMSVGDTLLASQPVRFTPDANYLNSVSLTQQPQLTQLVADQELLCTGEVEDVRGESGTFPADVRQLAASGQHVYHPRGFFCRWELLPDYPELTLIVNYSGLLDDEVLVLYLGPNNIVKLTKPSSGDPGGVFQATIWVDRSIFVEFQTTRGSTSAVGIFTVNWTSNSAVPKGLLTSRTMVVVLGCVSAAGAVLAALCFYCVCCSRRRRGIVIVSGESGAAQRVALMRVPSAVRELLPVKPYQPPEENPLPGASTEPDCCSICLIEFEAAENVTVLPCMHFYHKDCINSWLKRNCTCPLCKCNVLQAFNCTQENAQAQQQQRRHRSRHSRRSEGASSDGGDAMATGHATAPPLVGDAVLDGQGNPAANGLQPPADAAAGAAAGDAVVNVRALTASPGHAGDRRGLLPPLPEPRLNAGARPGALIPSAAAAAGIQSAWTDRTPSPASSMGNLPNGTVEVGVEDFAAAAAAAAAAIAAEQAATATDTASSQAAAPGATALNNAYEAAHASVSALRGSSRGLSRRLQGLLRTSSSGAAEAAAVAVELGQVPPQQPAADVSSRLATRSSPEVIMHVPGRGAISIYAYAGHPNTGDSDCSDDGGPPRQQGQQQQVRSSNMSPAALHNSTPGSQSANAFSVTTASVDGRSRSASRANASLPDVA